MTPIECRCCTRMMAPEQFRTFMNRGVLRRKRLCRQCEAGERPLRRKDLPGYVTPTPDPLSRLMATWRGPVNPAPLRWTA